MRDITGQQFGRLTAVALADSARMPSGGTRRRWRCKCECGSEIVTQQTHLTNGRSRSCGCFQRERVRELKTTHGGSDTKLYDVWTQMIQRCENKRNKSYPNYGGRGIKVCERWHDFALFLADMGHCPDPGLSIDRIDNDLGYAPGNCRWATALQQSHNSRPKRPRAAA